MVFHRSQYAWLCILLIIVGCKTPKVLPPPNLLRANHFDKSLQILRQGLHSDEFWPSIYAAEALIDAGYGFEATPVLYDKLESEGYDVYRASIAKALIKSNEQEGIVILQDIMLGNNEQAQLESLKGLFYEVTAADTAIVGNLTRSTESQEIKLYAQALLHITEKQKNADQIRGSLSSQDPSIRIATADILAFIGSSEQDTTQLETSLIAANTELEQFHMLRSLAMLDHNASRERLPQLTRSTDPSIRSEAALAIAEAWIVDQVDVVYPLLDDPSLAVRVRAAQALLTLNNSASLYRYLRLR